MTIPSEDISMSTSPLALTVEEFTAEAEVKPDLLAPLMERAAPPPRTREHEHGAGLIVGELMGLADDGATPLVCYPGQPGTAALRGRATVDLHGAHIGCEVALLFEQEDPVRPIVFGVLRGRAGWPLPERPAGVEVDADGERLIVSAKDQLVLRCGKASITLTRAGKVLIRGEYVESRASGTNRLKGGSVQIN
jgi:hypothetical protein